MQEGFSGGQMGMRGMGMRGFQVRTMHQRERGFLLARLLQNPALREKLGVTDEQAAKIRQQFTDFRIEQIRNRADLQVKRIELRNLMSADKPDRAAIDKKLQEISAAQLARERAKVDFHLAMRDALTPEQRQKLQQLRENFRTHGARGMGPHGPRSQRWQKQQETPPPPSTNPDDNGGN
jgi:Spy/CpxP family protein refolding chaperone